jgi:hypothetical protein
VEVCFICHKDNDIVEKKNPIKRSATVLWLSMLLLLKSCTTTIFYGWKFRSLCKILLTLRSDIPRATEYLVDERLGLLMNDCLTASMFCGDSTVRTQPAGFFFTAEALVLMFRAHNLTVRGKVLFLLDE